MVFLTAGEKRLTFCLYSARVELQHLRKRRLVVIRTIRIGLLAAAVLITVLEITGIKEFSTSPYTGILHHNLVIERLEELSPNRNLPLKRLDRIIAVDGYVLRNLNHFRYLTYSNTDLKVQVYRIENADSVFEVAVASTRQPEERLYRKLSRMIVGFTFIFVGMIVILKRPDILGILFTIICTIIAFILLERPVFSSPFLHIAGELIYDFMFIFYPAFFLHFSFLFPGKEIIRGTRRSRAINLMYYPPGVLFFAIFIMTLLNYTIGIQHRIVFIFENFIMIFWAVYMLTCLVVFIRTYTTSSRVQRIRFRLVFFGVILGIIPMLVVMLMRQFQPAIHVPYDHSSILFLSFISVSFAYAILKHGVFDLGIVLRKGLVFVILTFLVIAAYYLVVNVLGERYGLFRRLNRSIVTGAAVVLLVFAFSPAIATTQRLVDRVFYKDGKIFRGRFLDFSRKIQFVLDIEELSSFLTREMIDLFDVEHVHLFLKDRSGTYILRRSFPEDTKLPLTSFSPDISVIKLIRKERLPLMLEFFDRLWIKNKLDRISLELISISNASVIAPLIEQEELFGFILIGRKRSGKPYTPADAEVLELMGERGAAALRNIDLYHDSLEKKKLEEEIHLASEIQQRLLPGSPPTLKTAKILGDIRTTWEVGGDLYDFVELAPGKVGMAVADVSGKGIPASLLMTTLQASFRSEASNDRSPGEVLKVLNDVLYKRSAISKFATFFYATFEEETEILHYSNGGSFPPFVLHSDGSIVRLRRGGPLLGVEKDAFFNEGLVKLKTDDLVIIYTDGFIDQENEAREPYGEKRLIDFFRNNSRLSLESMIEKLFATLIAFGQDNLKDDMTIVLLRNNID